MQNKNIKAYEWEYNFTTSLNFKPTYLWCVPCPIFWSMAFLLLVVLCISKLQGNFCIKFEVYLILLHKTFSK